MSKTLVNIITEDNPIPAYLFIKEMYKEGDKLMYISAKDTEDDLEALSELFVVPEEQIEEIVLKNDIDELAYEKICRSLYGHLDYNTNYCVNLAGGTRYMALAVQQVFERFNTEFFYVQVEENLIVKSKFDNNIFNNDDLFYPIRHRMMIAEYLRAHEIQHDLSRGAHTPIRPEALAANILNLFVNNQFSEDDRKVTELLRNHYRNRSCIEIIDVEEIGGINTPPVPGLTDFLDFISFVPARSGYLNRDEIEYLTGGWFEEYVYYLIKKKIKPQDIALNVTISRRGINHTNELDVVFTKGNKLFVIECKTGLKENHIFNETVYKLCAISEALLGVSCCSYLVSLKKDQNGMLQRIADNMGIIFLDRDVLTTSRELLLALKGMDIQAHESQ